MNLLWNQYPHPVNFDFAERLHDGELSIAGEHFALHMVALGAGLYHLALANPTRWPEPVVNATFLPPDEGGTEAAAGARLEISAEAGLQLIAEDGTILLEAGPGCCFGVSGRRWLVRFKRSPAMQFYGLGEKHTPFERSGRAYWFWNTDAWADHPTERIKSGDYDPDYISIPYLIVKQANTYLGLLLDTAYPAFIAPDADSGIADGFELFPTNADEMFLGAENGPASLYILLGPSLAELTCKFQNLVGTTPLPPLWSLGYHQCRWGYRGTADLETLAEHFERHRFPADGLWLDIDYMDGYRVFSVDARHLPHPVETLADLNRRGFRVVPILDPGIKREAGYAVYDSGLAANHFCLNPTGKVYTGLVWPGQTVFPDFSLPETRRWWAGCARRFFALGFSGAWLDMNEPSTGSIECRDMLFERGQTGHDAHHNRYALLMAKATRQGLLAARPDQRPFLISRAGCTGSQRYCAHWTGDNFSSYRHLRRSIAKLLNLALSGIPFCGADVGGFGGDCSEALLIDWLKAAFLMPFFRNHSVRGSRAQEPWAYSENALDIIRRFVRLRYTLLPYLYNLFIDQEEYGEAILRPLFYDFDDDPGLPLALVDDQFMVGPAIMQAPFVRQKGGWREAVLPGRKWLRADTGRWVRGRRRLPVRRHRPTTPLFLREGSLIPFQPGKRTTNRTDLNHIGLLCCLPPDFSGRAHLRYRADDGLSFDYRRGRRTTVDVTAFLSNRRLHLMLNTVSEGFGHVAMVPYTVSRFRAVHFDIDGKQHVRHAIREHAQLTGRPFEWYRWD